MGRQLETNKARSDIANSDNNNVKESPSGSTLLVNILFSLSKEQKKHFFESVASTGVAYINRLPPKAEPIVLKLTKTVQRQ